MTVEPIPQPRTFGEMGFDAFYTKNLPIVYGYALRLCGGSVDRAQDLTQEAWVAEQLPACQPFVATVFESERRPAVITYRGFFDQDTSVLMVQYVAVHPTVVQATAMLDAMQEPAFLGECVPAYIATMPTDYADWDPLFPFYRGQELTPPTIEVDADDAWVRRYNSMSTDAVGAVTYGPEQAATAVIRVGRIVTSIDVMLIDPSGDQIATIDDFEAIVQRLAARAAAAQ